MPNSDMPEKPRALSYTEMMNEGRQTRSDENEQKDRTLEQRVEELERKVEHLQRAIQRQIRLSDMKNKH